MARSLNTMITETIEPFAGYVRIVSPFANITGLYTPDMAARLATALSELETTDLRQETREWIRDTTMRLACCSEKAEAVRDQIHKRGSSVASRPETTERVPAEWR
jgi:hypothetical protein